MKISDKRLLSVLCIAAVFLVFLKIGFQVFTVPSPAMDKTILVGDMIIGNRFSYGYRLPFSSVRLSGGKVKRNDIVIFNAPNEDTAVLEIPEQSYFQVLNVKEAELKAQGQNPATARQQLVKSGLHLIAKKVYDRTIYIKRCVALPGDKIQIRNGEVSINDQGSPDPPFAYQLYLVKIDDVAGRDEEIESTYQAQIYQVSDGAVIYRMTRANAEKLKNFKGVQSVTRWSVPAASSGNWIFPQSPSCDWTIDNFGPIRIPAKGDTLTINDTTLYIYGRIIGAYEGNVLDKKNGQICINGKPSTQYVCRMDYYWMMGDNRSNSMDSRFWGFLPEDHIIAKYSCTLLNTKGNKRKD